MQHQQEMAREAGLGKQSELGIPTSEGKSGNGMKTRNIVCVCIYVLIYLYYYVCINISF